MKLCFSGGADRISTFGTRASYSQRNGLRPSAPASIQ
jgi:hypothetical protein